MIDYDVSRDELQEYVDAREFADYSIEVKDGDIHIGFTDESNVVIGFNIYEEFQVKLNRPADKNHTKEE
mgnify:CR=1 FL=1